MPATSAAPLSGRERVVRIFTVVDLPAPLGPTRPNTLPGATPKLTPASAFTPLGYVFTRPVASIAISVMGTTALSEPSSGRELACRAVEAFQNSSSLLPRYFECQTIYLWYITWQGNNRRRAN